MSETVDTSAKTGAPSDRTRLRRYNWLATYDRDTINAIIDAGIVCQVGYVIDGMPYVTPTNHWRIDDYIYWHGSSASRMLKHQQKGIPVCFTVTHLDGIVFSRETTVVSGRKRHLISWLQNVQSTSTPADLIEIALDLL